MNWTPDLVVYHGNCQDGFTAAWVVHQKYGDLPAYLPAFHGRVLPLGDFKDKNVLFVDFTFKKPIMDEIAEVAKFVVILDHHKSAEADLAEYPSFKVGDRQDFADTIATRPSKIVAGFDMQRSGAGLAWDFLFGTSRPRPVLVNVVEDRDLWLFKRKGTKAISMWLFSFDYSFDQWSWCRDELETLEGRHMAVDCGEALERKHMKDIRELLETNQFVGIIGGHHVKVANMPYTMASDAANLLAQQDPAKFAATFYLDGDGRTHFSLRSIKGVGMDVSAIASRFGGGGHPNAAGFMLASDPITIDLNP